MTWNKELIVEKLKEFGINKENISGSDIKHSNQSLYRACFRHFGSCKEAISAAGLNYKESQIKWNKDKVIKNIQEKNTSNIQLNDHYANRNYQKLYAAGQRYFGSWKEAVNAAGINYESIRKSKENNYWTPDKFKDRLFELINDNEQLSSQYIQDNHQDLYSAALKIYGSWKDAINFHGLDYPDISLYLRWKPEEVIEEIKRLHRIKSDLSNKEIRITKNTLFKAAVRYFGSWKRALDKADIDYNIYLKTKPKGYWSEKQIINEIRKMFSEGKPINSSYVMTNNKSLYGTARRMFKTWEESVTLAGFDYNAVRNDINTTSYCGYMFEKVVDDVLKELNINYTKHNTGNALIKPDYIFNEVKWGDAKLSKWSIFHSDTVSKYKHYCNFLWIIFMRGEQTDELVNVRVRQTSIFLLIKQLPRSKQKHYLNLLNKISEKLN
ncbi:hypothetical protein [Bacillus sp. CHD6a]|uniref:hypothetical protein n=1 Tax=Bacillus sp. CHD6a TaxID=1643452 RepID=UPI0006CDF1A0|nr:hypothetical protein [Bacillus sp. CHD6a]KPB04727.1 hypothetical protein AAV98_10455 [Bacillus sp. CHD6a]